MATSTFDKRIILDKKAASVLADALSDGNKSIRPDIAKEKEESEKAWIRLLDRYNK